MNTNTAQSEPDSVEALLPWHAAGTLNARDMRRVEDALARDPVLARQYAAVRDELAETIHLNEDLGAPSARAMQKLFAAIDAGLALYESSMTVTPSARSKTSIRRRDTACSAPSAAGSSAQGSPRRSATAAAASTLPTWWAPATASSTDA